MAKIQHFVGENLDRVLNQLGHKRLPNEDDWSFRKRVYPDLALEYNPKMDQTATEVIFGKYADDFTGMEAMRGMQCIQLRDRKSLEKFVNGFSMDPLVFGKG